MPLYARALALDPDRAATHDNLGPRHKYRGAWAEPLHHKRCAGDAATRWNLGIAATALAPGPRRARPGAAPGSSPQQAKSRSRRTSA